MAAPRRLLCLLASQEPDHTTTPQTPALISYRFNELAVFNKLPFVLDLVGCYPCLDLVPQPLKREAAKY